MRVKTVEIERINWRAQEVKGEEQSNEYTPEVTLKGTIIENEEIMMTDTATVRYVWQLTGNKTDQRYIWELDQFELREIFDRWLSNIERVLDELLAQDSFKYVIKSKINEFQNKFPMKVS